MTAALSRETWIGVGATALAFAAMAVDHLMGDDPAILEDPLTFVVSSLLCIGLALFVFVRLVPGVKAAGSEVAATRAIVLSALAFVGGPLVFWLGVPFVLAAGGIALGLLGRRRGRRRLALAAVALGTLVIGVGTLGYGAQLVDKLS